MPRFSVIMPCYNAADSILAAIQSLVAQTCEDWEVLVVDGGSTDETAAIVMRTTYLDSRVRLIGHAGRGVGAARNAGAALARGTILCFCDADDQWPRDKLSQLSDAFAAKHVDATYGRFALSEGGQTRGVSDVEPGNLSVSMLLSDNPIQSLSTLAVRRRVFDATGGFETTAVQNADLDWLIRLVGMGHRVVGTDSRMVADRATSTGLSSHLDTVLAGGRAVLASAARFGHVDDARDEAIYLCYLARRAIRLGAPASEVLSLALAGFRVSPRGWFSDMRRGALTLLGAIAAPVLPMGIRRSLFSS